MSVTKIYNKDILDSIVSGFFFTKGNKLTIIKDLHASPQIKIKPN